ncbi:MAG: DUF1501 domain-containing protein [Isosphaeraceae bacterium]|nr:DUF1501 domain-containing protein [Isosphaeraceae bacterium]
MMEKSILRVAMSSQGVIGRRGFVKGIGIGAAGLSGLSFTDLLAVNAAELRKRNMACILLWMAGGPSQMETFDPKPGTTNGGTTKAIETAVPSIQIAHGWENLAKVAKDVAFIRSMTNKEGNHQRATYQLHTGYPPTGTVKHPNFGCVVANELADESFDLPHTISIGGGTVGSGLLGVGLEPFVVQDPKKPPANVIPPVPGQRFTRRLNLMRSLEMAGFVTTGGADKIKDHTSLYKQTYNMVMSKHMRAFDLSTEDPRVRASYGETPFGQGCLLARRLVEVGATFVEVRSNGWDTHNELDIRKKTEPVDSGFASLVADLKSRGMLEKTLVIWMGEFGRTPKISPRGGRDHFPRAFNVALAGGGIKGGQVIGASSADGNEVKDRPVQVNDLLVSFCHALKIDPSKENMSSVGRPIKIVDGGKAVKELFA